MLLGLWVVLLLYSALQSVLCLPFEPENIARRQIVRARVIHIGDASPSPKSTMTVIISGAATSTPTGSAFTICVGFNPATTTTSSDSTTSSESLITTATSQPSPSSSTPLPSLPSVFSPISLSSSPPISLSRPPSQAVVATTTGKSPFSTISVDLSKPSATNTDDTNPEIPPPIPTSRPSGGSSGSSSSAPNPGLQKFTGSLGGLTAPAVTAVANDQFQVDGIGSLFNKVGEALNRSCAEQHNHCADAANASDDKSLSVGACDTQQHQCLSSNGLG
ncbi:hypothetical protein MIND_00237800 [Mycena indigotica]|uniref:Uncharacterized protein n=1 Tax=Mycena indigotica TaxID=2126181 RepID=A0A8H6T715_9AGAR|nr:uncharacterized protein MIND_00237800 [Mycena indigotica]KAF7312248.1 hypothetical protein MIND_00237800 [Mycena indigotica]